MNTKADDVMAAGKMPAREMIEADRLVRFVGALFVSAGLSAKAASTVAEALVEADLQGVASHGVMHAPVYLKRLAFGSISPRDTAEPVIDLGSIAVLDAKSMLGHLAADQAMNLAVDKAKAHGVSVVAVRNSGHFGAAGRYAVAASRRGCVGISLSNSVPLIAVPGGAEPIVGNSPLAIALPSDGEDPVVLDMAMSVAALGRIRMALRKGEAIPSSWALASDGSPTTDPEAAIAGMLQPIAGFKGLGLAFMIDLLCGGLSDGPWGGDVVSIYGDPTKPVGCSLLFIAIDVSAFRDLAAFQAMVGVGAERIRQSKRADGVDRLTAPGDRRAERQRRHNGVVPLERSVAEALRAAAVERGLNPNDL